MRGKSTVFIFGGSGLIGSRLISLMKDEFIIIAPSHDEIDVRDKKVVDKKIREVKPDYILYSAGLASVDAADAHKDVAFALNSDAVSVVASIASSLKIPLLYLSTDAVFNGSQSERPYTEEDLPNPISIYGKSKHSGERRVLQGSDINCVVRLIMAFSPAYKKKLDFVRKIVNALRSNKRIIGISDQVTNPILVDYLVNAVVAVIKQRASGIYHIGSVDFATNYDFARRIAQCFSLDKKLIYRVRLEEFFAGKAKRSKYCWLDTTKFRRDFGEGILHTIDDSLNEYRKLFQD